MQTKTKPRSWWTPHQLRSGMREQWGADGITVELAAEQGTTMYDVIVTVELEYGTHVRTTKIPTLKEARKRFTMERLSARHSIEEARR